MCLNAGEKDGEKVLPVGEKVGENVSPKVVGPREGEYEGRDGACVGIIVVLVGDRDGSEVTNRVGLLVGERLSPKLVGESVFSEGDTEGLYVLCLDGFAE